MSYTRQAINKVFNDTINDHNIPVKNKIYTLDFNIGPEHRQNNMDAQHAASLAASKYRRKKGK